MHQHEQVKLNLSVISAAFFFWQPVPLTRGFLNPFPLSLLALKHKANNPSFHFSRGEMCSGNDQNKILC